MKWPPEKKEQVTVSSLDSKNRRYCANFAQRRGHPLLYIAQLKKGLYEEGLNLGG
jgi:hypothetical protein